MKLTSKQKGIMFLTLSALCFASMNLSAKLAGSLPSMQKAFFRNLIAAVVSFAVLINSKEKFHLNKKNLPFFFMRAIFGTMGIVGNFYAIEHMLLADAFYCHSVFFFIFKGKNKAISNPCGNHGFFGKSSYNKTGLCRYRPCDCSSYRSLRRNDGRSRLYLCPLSFS